MNQPTPETASIAASAVSALGASTCCVLPLALVSMGVGGAWVAQLRALERFQRVFIALALAAPASAGEPRVAVLDVPSMNCSLCPISVRKALTRVPGVIDASAELASKRAVVNYDPDNVTPEQLAAAVTNAGFPATAHSK